MTTNGSNLDDPLPDIPTWTLTGRTTTNLAVTLTMTADPALLTIRLHPPDGCDYPRHPELIVRGERADEATRLVQTAIREAARYVISQHGPLTRSQIAPEPTP